MPEPRKPEAGPGFEAAVAHVPKAAPRPTSPPPSVYRPAQPEIHPNAPDPGLWAAKLAVSSAQVAAGCRPAAQLHRWVTRDVFEMLQSRAQTSIRMARGGEPLRAHFTVRRVRRCDPAVGVVEAAVILDDGRRPWAVAIRLEWRRDRWIASVLQFL